MVGFDDLEESLPALDGGFATAHRTATPRVTDAVASRTIAPASGETPKAITHRGELPGGKPAAGTDGDQQLGPVVQILPDLATAAAMAFADALAPPELGWRVEVHVGFQ